MTRSQRRKLRKLNRTPSRFGVVSLPLQDWQSRRYLRKNPIPHPVVQFAPDVERNLRAENEYFCGVAVYAREMGQWRLKTCTPCLSFLKGKTPLEAKVDLIRRGFRWEWV
jgi:hypothetical protein